MNSSTAVDSAIEKIRALHHRQLKLVDQLLDELLDIPMRDQRTSEITVNSQEDNMPDHCSWDYAKLSVGDRVQLTNSRTICRNGDKGTIIKLHEKLVAVRLDKNDNTAKRSAKHLSCLKDL